MSLGERIAITMPHWGILANLIRKLFHFFKTAICHEIVRSIRPNPIMRPNPSAEPRFGFSQGFGRILYSEKVSYSMIFFQKLIFNKIQPNFGNSVASECIYKRIVIDEKVFSDTKFPVLTV